MPYNNAIALFYSNDLIINCLAASIACLGSFLHTLGDCWGKPGEEIESMSEHNLPTAVNKHYLDKVMDLAEERDVAASEDIFDARGMKLVAKGVRISRTLQEKLILHKLRKPLESSITVEGGVGSETIFKEALQVAETIEPVGHILKSVHADGRSPFDLLKSLKLGSAMSMMLTITERGGATALAHSVMVSLISICLAKRLGMDEKGQMTVALAGLLHDIGELYIEPEYLSSKRRLLPHEWRHVVIHPRVGQMLIDELESYPPAVGLAVAEHHERFDGAGYPRQALGRNISAAGQAVSVAEMISGVFMRPDNALERAELALKIIPGEHARELVSAVSSTLRDTRKARADATGMLSAESHSDVRKLYDHISQALQNGQELLDLPHIKSKKGRELLVQAVHQTNIIRSSFSSTGLDLFLLDKTALQEAYKMEILFEVTVATREIQWRLRDVARNLALHSAALDPQEANAFQAFIKMLDEGC
jgi:HD-GYP domain-containing protein (c-di-GMP phosphodiesterase class II)